MTAPLLSVRNLRTEFRTKTGSIVAVDDVSFSVDRGEVLAIVGESGSGKSVTALSIMGLLARGTGSVTGGEILFDGVDLRKLSRRAMRRIRGQDIAMIFQEPMTALNPVFTVGDQIAEVMEVRGVPRRKAMEHAVDLLERVRIPSPRQRASEYPHQLSGGMRQRAMIAMALACDPKLLIADEPTTALDVTIQAQILDLLQVLREDTNMAMILITHDLGVVAGHADKALVMYCGRVVEEAGIRELFAEPSHPYTQALLDCVPRMDRNEEEMQAIAGSVPPPSQWQDGCRFASRCGLVEARCTARRPPLHDLGAAHAAACVLAEPRVVA
jgi:peptide/nickel transport system ATP-binding protein